MAERTILALLRRSKPIGRVVNDKDYRSVVGAHLSLAIDAPWAIGNLALGAWSASPWLATLGAYYLLLAAMRALLVFAIRQGDDARTAKTMRACGLLIASLTLVTSGIVVLATTTPGSFAYPDVVIYAVATYAFVSLGTAMAGIASRRRHANQLMFVLSNVNLANALVSILALEVAMMALFGTNEDPSFVTAMTMFTGTMVTAADIAIGTALVRRSKRYAASSRLENALAASRSYRRSGGDGEIKAHRACSSDHERPKTKPPSTQR